MIGIYKITNLINNKCYIGQSIDINRRIRDHINSYQTQSYVLYKAMRKYGLENFSFEVIEECPVEKLNEREIYYIKLYDSYLHGYNSTTGGDGTPNTVIKLSNEDIDNIYDLLLNTTIPQKDIAEKFHVGQDTISEINHGKTRVKKGFSYPLRVNKNLPNYCIDCGKEIAKLAIRCKECDAKHRIIPLDQMLVTREELKQLIRTTPFTTIAKHFGVTDNAIRKWCDKFNLPRRKKDINNYSDEEWEKV